MLSRLASTAPETIEKRQARPVDDVDHAPGVTRHAGGGLDDVDQGARSAAR